MVSQITPNALNKTQTTQKIENPLKKTTGLLISNPKPKFQTTSTIIKTQFQTTSTKAQKPQILITKEQKEGMNERERERERITGKQWRKGNQRWRPWQRGKQVQKRTERSARRNHRGCQACPERPSRFALALQHGQWWVGLRLGELKDEPWTWNSNSPLALSVDAIYQSLLQQ